MRIAVMGTGGVGGYFGGRLAEAGEDVSFVARGAHLQAMQSRGLAIRSGVGDTTLTPVQATDDPAALGTVDLVLFTVKLYDTESAADVIRPLIGPNTGVVTFQNGITGTETLTRTLGIEHVLGGVAKIAAVIGEPGVIHHTGTMADLVFGELDGRTTDRVEALARALQAAGVQHAFSDRIGDEIWYKMVLLSTFSGITSLLRLPVGPIRSDPETRALLTDGLAEALAVARAAGAALTNRSVDDLLLQIDRMPAEMKASMLGDLERGRRLELPWLSGTIARLGREHGVATPVHGLITTALKLHQDGSR
ncbi:MAG: 2-dehydropantoate 2-reductase [Pseudomonadota bacterium]